MEPVAPLDEREESRRLGDLLRNGVSLLSVGAGAIHFAVIQSHFEEYWAAGLFFVAVAWFQVLWAILIVARPTRPWAVAGAVINAGIVAGLGGRPTPRP